MTEPHDSADSTRSLVAQFIGQLKRYRAQAGDAKLIGRLDDVLGALHRGATGEIVEPWRAIAMIYTELVDDAKERPEVAEGTLIILADEALERLTQGRPRWPNVADLTSPEAASLAREEYLNVVKASDLMAELDARETRRREASRRWSRRCRVSRFTVRFTSVAFGILFLLLSIIILYSRANPEFDRANILWASIAALPGIAGIFWGILASNKRVDRERRKFWEKLLP